MSDLVSLLRSRGVDRAMAVIGLDFAALFGKVMGEPLNPYACHDWLVKDAPGLGPVVNAVPWTERLDDSFWEEWFQRDGVKFHHILTLRKPPHWDEVFEAPARDDVHPPVTLGRTWYVVEDPDMRPVLLR